MQRSIDELIENIVHSLPSGSEEFIAELDEMRKIINGVFQRSSMGKKISDFTEDDVRKWRWEEFNSSSTDPAETLAVITQVFKIVTGGLVLRFTQLLSILLFWRSKKDLLAQISTGEGKTWVGVSLAVMKVLYQGSIDIITSSNLLASRDAQEKENVSVYAMFDITVGHNSDDDVEKRKSVYANADVIYGSLTSFQRDYLLDTFFNKNITGGRKRKNLMVDEIDSMMLDKGELNNEIYDRNLTFIN